MKGKKMNKNPFLIKYTDITQSPANSFLSLFNPKTLDSINCYINDGLFGIKYFQSSPGAGKTSIFRAFSPEVLKVLLASRNASETSKDLYLYMYTNGIIDDKIKTLTISLSCAKNYDIINELVPIGRSKQILFSLLNSRIIISALRSICTTCNADFNDEVLEKISFKTLPDEFLSNESIQKNGLSLFKWACKEEKNICNFLDSFGEGVLENTIFQSTLITLQLFSPQNISFNDEPFVENVLMILDDFHKLSNEQRQWINDSLCQLRPQMNVWIGERLDALGKQSLISSDGMEGREYNCSIILDDSWAKHHSAFPSWLQNIADRRVKMANIEGLSEFNSCIDTIRPLLDDINRKAIEKGIEDCIDNIKKYSNGNPSKYDYVIEHINEIENIEERAKNIMGLEIFSRINSSDQYELCIGPTVSVNQFKNYIERTDPGLSVAEYYFSIRNEIPYYYGFERLKKLSSFNIEQFLSFCSNIFDLSITKSLSSKNRSNLSFTVSAKEQELAIKTTAEKRWNDIPRRFEQGNQIQAFIAEIVNISQKGRDKYRNSYSGGAITGIGITKEDCLKIISEDQYKKLSQLLSCCISARYFERREVEQGGKSWVVLYLNRWICAKYNLPLSYGGWKPFSTEKLCKIMYSENNQ